MNSSDKKVKEYLERASLLQHFNDWREVCGKSEQNNNPEPVKAVIEIAKMIQKEELEEHRKKKFVVLKNHENQVD